MAGFVTQRKRRKRSGKESQGVKIKRRSGDARGFIRLTNRITDLRPDPRSWKTRAKIRRQGAGVVMMQPVRPAVAVIKRILAAAA